MEHFYQSIKGWFNWPELYARAARIAPNPAVFVEIGCYLGKSTSCLAVEAFNSGKKITIYAVDLWDPANKIGCTVEEFESNLRIFTNVCTTVKVIPKRGDSVAVARNFSDQSVDFVWVDGNHRYPFALADIKAWWPKLKNGGWMGGDDLIHGGVRQAVEEFFGPECLPGKGDSGNWVRFQSATCVGGKGSIVHPVSGGWVWWARSKSPEWVPEGLPR